MLASIVPDAIPELGNQKSDLLPIHSLLTPFVRVKPRISIDLTIENLGFLARMEVTHPLPNMPLPANRPALQILSQLVSMHPFDAFSVSGREVEPTSTSEQNMKSRFAIIIVTLYTCFNGGDRP